LNVISNFCSELLTESSLLQHPVRRMARLDPAVDWKVAARFRAEPDLVITLTGSHEVATGRPQHPFEFRGEVGHGRAESRAGGEFVLAGDELERNFSASLTGLIQLDELGHHAQELPLHFLKRWRLGGETWHIRFCHIPYLGFPIPETSNGVALGSHRISAVGSLY
jgi:hypothetical protein